MRVARCCRECWLAAKAICCRRYRRPACSLPSVRRRMPSRNTPRWRWRKWIAITHGDEGIKVSVKCPQGVRTNMLRRDPENILVEGSVSPEEVAEAAIRGIAEERFLILPHPQVAEYFLRKAQDYDRWLRGMRRLQRQVRDRNRSAPDRS